MTKFRYILYVAVVVLAISTLYSVKRWRNIPMNMRNSKSPPCRYADGRQIQLGDRIVFDDTLIC